MNQPGTASGRLNQEQLDEIVRRLVNALAPRRIYLFGSHAYGQPHADSDLDFLILVGDEELARDDQDQRGYHALRGLFLPIELHIRGLHDFQRWAGVPLSFESEVLSKGRLVYGA